FVLFVALWLKGLIGFSFITREDGIMAGITIQPEMVEVGGHKKIKITIREGERVIDADLVNPLNASQRKKAAARLAESCGDVQQMEAIERALLDSIRLLVDDPSTGSGQGGKQAGDETVEGVEGAA